MTTTRTAPKQTKTRTKKATLALFYATSDPRGYVVTALDKRGNEGQSRLVLTGCIFDDDEFAAAARAFDYRREAARINAAGPQYLLARLDKLEQAWEQEQKYNLRLIIPKIVPSEIARRARLMVPSFTGPGHYEVHIGADGGGTAFCGCGAYARRLKCKHLDLSRRHLRGRAGVTA